MNTALITGASSGIGKELARIHASKKGDLVLVARSEDKLLELKAGLERDYGVKVHVFAADLSLPGAATRVWEFTQQAGLQIDILVNNAGFGVYGKFYETDLARNGEMLQLNITALTELTWMFLRDMTTRNRGRILNVASTAGFQPCPWFASYAATKSYVINFSQAVADELAINPATSGITVTAYCPGATETGFSSAAAMEHSGLFRNRKNPGPVEVAEDAYRSMMGGKPLAIYGWLYNLLIFTQRLAPRSFVINITRKMTMPA